MKESLLSNLVCPVTQEPLRLIGEEREGAEIIGGILVAGENRYPIFNGVPCFLNKAQQIAAKDGFAPMWRYRKEGQFEGDNLYGITPKRKAQWVTTKFEEALKPGDWVLDAGCGSAETTYAMARMYPQTNFVGLEFCDAIRLSAPESSELPNLHFVQADIANPPFAPSHFSHVYSLGVLHHTPSTRTAFESAARLVRRDGELLVWLYPLPMESPIAAQLYMVRDLAFLGQGHKIPPDTRLTLSKLYALSAMPGAFAAYSIYKFLSKFGGDPEDKVISEDMTIRDLFATTAFTVYDTISPKYQHRHSKKEVTGWYTEAGFAEVETDGLGTFRGRLGSRAAV